MSSKKMLWRNGRSRRGSPWYEAVTGLDSLQDNEAIGRDHGVQHAAAAENGGRTEIPDVVTPILRQIAVEHLLPVTIGQARVAHIVAVEVSVVVKARQNQEIVAFAPSPPGEHAIDVVHMEDVDQAGAQPRAGQPQVDQVPVEGEEELAARLPIAVEILPVGEDVVVEEVLLEPDLLAEEEHGGSGRQDGDAEGEAAPGLRVPPRLADQRGAVGGHDDRPLGALGVARLVVRLVVDDLVAPAAAEHPGE